MKNIFLILQLIVTINLVLGSNHHSKTNLDQQQKRNHQKHQNEEHQSSEDMQQQGENYDQIKTILDKNLKIISVIGGPGTGKGTQCAYLQQNFGFKHIAAGDLIRRQLQEGETLGQEIRRYTLEGKLIPSETLIRMILNELERIQVSNHTQNVVLLDGFPRNKENIEKWEQMIGRYLKIDTYLYLDCPMEEMEQRLLERGKTSGRADDNKETIRKRLETFKQETETIISEISKNAQNTIIQISSNKEVEQISSQLRQKFIDFGYGLIQVEKLQTQQLL